MRVAEERRGTPCLGEGEGGEGGNKELWDTTTLWGTVWLILSNACGAPTHTNNVTRHFLHQTEYYTACRDYA